MALPFPDVDEELVERIVDNLKSQGIFDQFRKDCLLDVDSRPACHNLKNRVNGAVAEFLSKQPWKEDLNKNFVRESLKTHVQQHYLEVGVNRIVEQVVNPKIFSIFMPRVEDLVYNVMGVDKPCDDESQSSNQLRYYMSNDTPQPSRAIVYAETMPNDLDPVSPGSINESGNESANLNDSAISNKNIDDGDNVSRDVNKESNLDVNEASNESKLSGMSELSSHGSTTKLDISESAHLPGKSEMHCDVSNTHNLSNVVDGEKSKGLNEIATSGYGFDNFSNLREKLLKTDPLNKNLDKEKNDPSSSHANCHTPEFKDASQINDLKELKDDSVSLCGNTEDSRIGKVPKSPVIGMYSEDSVGSNCSQRSKVKLEKIHLLNESTRNSIAMDCDDSSASFVEKKFEGAKEVESVSCVESLKEESQMSLASNDSRKFTNFANLKMINENSQIRSAGSSPETSKNISDEVKKDDSYRKSSSHSRRSRDRYDSKHRSRNSSRDRKYSKDSKSKHDSDSKKYSSSNREKYSSRSRDDRHRSDKKSSEDTKRERDSKHGVDDKSRRDKVSKHKSGDDHRSSRNRGNSSEDDKRVKKAEIKSSDDKEKDSKSISDKTSKDRDSKYGSRKDDSKRSSDDQKYSKSRESESKYGSDSRKSSKEKTSRTSEDDRYSRKEKDAKRSSEDYRSSRNREKDDSKNSSSVDKESKSSSYDHRNSSSRNKDSKQSSEDDKSSRKDKEKSLEISGDNIEHDKGSKSRNDSETRSSRTDKKPSSDRKGESGDRKKSVTESGLKKDDKDSKKRKRENCSEDTEKKESRRSRDRDDGGHRSSGGTSSRDQKESGDKKRKSSSSKQEKTNTSKNNSAKDQVDSYEATNTSDIDLILKRIHTSIQDETSVKQSTEKSESHVKQDFFTDTVGDQDNFKKPLEVSSIPEKQKNIQSYKQIQSEVKTGCKNESYYVNNVNIDRSKTDQILITDHKSEPDNKHESINICQSITDQIQIMDKSGSLNECTETFENTISDQSLSGRTKLTDKSDNKNESNEPLSNINSGQSTSDQIKITDKNENNGFIENMNTNQSTTNQIHTADKNENNDCIEIMNTDLSTVDEIEMTNKIITNEHFNSNQPLTDLIQLADKSNNKSERNTPIEHIIDQIEITDKTYSIDCVESLNFYQSTIDQQSCIDQDQLQIIDKLDQPIEITALLESGITNEMTTDCQINTDTASNINEYSDILGQNSLKREEPVFNQLVEEQNIEDIDIKHSPKPLDLPDNQSNCDKMIVAGESLEIHPQDEIVSDFQKCSKSTKNVTSDDDFYGFNQTNMDNSFKSAVKFENFLKRAYGPALNDYLRDKCFSLTDNNLNSIGIKNDLKFLTDKPNAVCKKNLTPACSNESNENRSPRSPIAKYTVCNLLNENSLVSRTDANSSEINFARNTMTNISVGEKTSGLLETSKEIGQTKVNEDVISLCESSSSDRGFTLPSVTEDMLDNFMMENIVDKMDGGYNSSDSDVEGWNVPITPDAIHLTDIEKDEPMSDDDNCAKKANSGQNINLSELNPRSKEGKKSPGRPKEVAKKVLTVRAKQEKKSPQSRTKELRKMSSVRSKQETKSPPLHTKEEKTSPRMNQRYTDGDLYKPRPLITNPSRRNRVGSKNGSKPTRGTKRAADSMEFSENKRPR